MVSLVVSPQDKLKFFSKMVLTIAFALGVSLKGTQQMIEAGTRPASVVWEGQSTAVLSTSGNAKALPIYGFS
ncbi:MAG TPA: hypothetical protein VFB82_04285 [Blastocatellia bacterium]|jgi:hypothetical protein|nr:hypothetical protein [Blastocatellia bacterium]